MAGAASVEGHGTHGLSPRLAAALALVATLGILGSACMAPAPPPSDFGSVQVAGSQWLDGSGVNVYSNGGIGYCCGAQDYLNGIPVGTEWQCVELAQRLYTFLGWHRGIFAGVYQARDIYFQAAALGMQAYPNGGGYIPVPGDLIVLDAPAGGGAGHVSVVNTVVGGQVSVVEQNFGSGRGMYLLIGSTLSRDGLPVLGTVHSSADLFR